MEGLYKKVMVIGAVVVVLAVLAFSVRSAIGGRDIRAITGNVIGNTPAGNPPVGSSGDVQYVNLRMSGSGYVLEPSSLRKNVPVRMTVDLNSVQGCMRSVVIPAFGVNAYVQEGNNVISFTPTSAGTFTITCSMGMGRGSFTVLEDDGTESSFVEQVQVQNGAGAGSGGSCGMGSGGCGCGMIRQ